MTVEFRFFTFLANLALVSSFGSFELFVFLLLDCSANKQLGLLLFLQRETAILLDSLWFTRVVLLLLRDMVWLLVWPDEREMEGGN